MEINATPLLTLPRSGALGPYLRVKISGGVPALAGAEEADIGTTCERYLASGLGQTGVATVVTPKAPGTTKMIAAAAFDAFVRLYGAADGKVSATPNGNFIGLSMEAATADGDEVEVLRLPGSGLGATVVLEHHTADDTLTAEESGSTHTNLGASGAVKLTLPQVAGKGVRFRFSVMAAQELRITPGAAGAIYINGAKQADNKYIAADDEGECVELTSDGNGDWISGPINGTWTVES